MALTRYTCLDMYPLKYQTGILWNNQAELYIEYEPAPQGAVKLENIPSRLFQTDRRANEVLRMDPAWLDDTAITVENEKRRVQTGVFIAYLVFVVALFWVGMAVFLGATKVSFLGLFIVLGAGAAILLAKTRYTILARCTLLLTSNIGILGAVYVVDSVADIDYLFMTFIGAPFLYFSVKKELHLIVAFTSLGVLSGLFVWLFGTELFGPPEVGYDVALKYFAPASWISATLFILAEFGFFVVIMERAIERLRQTSRAANAANKAKSDFLANMSHEIRTPMNGVVGLIEVLEQGELDAQQKGMISTIRDSSFSLLRIIDDILDSSKIEAGKLELRLAPTQLRPEIERISKGFARTAKLNQVTFSLFLDPDVPDWLVCDAGRIRQIVVNLLSNALKFSRPEKEGELGFVQLRVELEFKGQLKISVRDTGIGMSEEVKAQIFKPFTQSEEHSKRKFGGTGLGLTIVHQLTGMMGGTIHVDSELGSGSTFSVHLPFSPINGPVSRPDLTGVKVLGLVEPEFARSSIRLYAEASGAGFELFLDETALVNRLRELGSGAIVVIGYLDPKDASVVHGHLADEFKDFGMLVFDEDEHGQPGLVSKNHYVVHWAPMLPSELWQGLAVLAGRKAPVLASPTDEVAQDDGPKTPDVKKCKVLLVEDNLVNQEVIKVQLTTLGYQVEIAADGREGLEMWREGEFDVVLTDCHMPMMDGFEMTGEIRAAESRDDLNRTPVVAITANALAGEADICLNAGMDDYLSKPVRLQDLDRMLLKWTDDVRIQ